LPPTTVCLYLISEAAIMVIALILIVILVLRLAACRQSIAAA
jgi:hypothetical protein